ncbi:unnamed protein product [Arabidopsis thaliana]|uniref:DnaJ domain n=2 Tax=Arabidopsis TaxID=3701 RepID=A0A8T2CTM8_9BRAS|nr:DnaJ domain [Arabidopsis thaliana x Arabidopsis arenosa]OAO89579.1 hypothetical protein AXX17_AT5G09080 [Arabidopsis thaliana]CAA0401607.1 unnamed protein product [Arabidopsis thaliana]CAD5331231.1 unnamed protein product [Arabidopsis thaliana]VYS66342.1 unnamed protein product [Arabidopsis thaliana]
MVSDGGGENNRAEADQLLATSEKLLASSDFHGAKTFAIRACEADPSRTDAADYILAIADTLLAGETTIGDSKVPDWYAVLRISRLTQSPEHVATQYRRLTLLLKLNINRLPFADQALKLVSDAWYVLSDPPRKSIYDRELQLSQTGQSEKFQDSPLQSQAETLENPTATSFWTACPYCFSLFEYPKGYEECTLRCQMCRKAFEAVKTQTPPVESNGEGVYFGSWAMFPVGLTSHPNTSNWSPISHLSVCTGQSSSDQQSNLKATPRNDDVDIYIAISDDD